FGGLPAHARSRNDGGVLAQPGRPLDAGVGHGFARGDYGELREAVDEIGALVIEIGAVIVGHDLRSITEAQGGAIGRLYRTDSGTAFAKGATKFFNSGAQRGDGADTRNGYAVHALGSDGGGIGRTAGNQPFHALDHLAHIADLFGRFIRYGDVKFIFQSE